MIKIFVLGVIAGIPTVAFFGFVILVWCKVAKRYSRRQLVHLCALASLISGGATGIFLCALLLIHARAKIIQNPLLLAILSVTLFVLITTLIALASELRARKGE